MKSGQHKKKLFISFPVRQALFFFFLLQWRLPRGLDITADAETGLFPRHSTAIEASNSATSPLLKLKHMKSNLAFVEGDIQLLGISNGSFQYRRPCQFHVHIYFVIYFTYKNNKNFSLIII